LSGAFTVRHSLRLCTLDSFCVVMAQAVDSDEHLVDSPNANRQCSCSVENKSSERGSAQ
jgi:hypothetical protein